jgi:hypothetical protein
MKVVNINPKEGFRLRRSPCKIEREKETLKLTSIQTVQIKM